MQNKRLENVEIKQLDKTIRKREEIELRQALRKETEGDKRKKKNNCWKIPSSPSRKSKLPQNSVGVTHVEGSMTLSRRRLKRCQGGNILQIKHWF